MFVSRIGQGLFVLGGKGVVELLVGGWGGLVLDGGKCIDEVVSLSEARAGHLSVIQDGAYM